MVAVRCYTRVSTEEQAESGYSLPAQKEKLKAFLVSQEDWRCAGWYTDEGESAKSVNRPELQRLLNEAQRGDVVLVYKLDRMTRSVRDLDDLLREFEQKGITFRSVTEHFDTTSAGGRLFIRLLTEIAQWERETISERSAFGKQKKVTSGEWGGGSPPFGYATVPGEKVKNGKTLLKLVPDQQYGHLIPLIFDRYLTGHGTRAICKWLNDELGVRTPAGARFRNSSLARLLRNPIYCGDVVYGKRKQGAHVTRVPGTHQPLVSRETFERIQEMFSVRKLYAPRQATGKYPLSGVARCGVCGGPISMHLRKNAKTTLCLYRCHNYVCGVGCGDGTQKPLSSVSGPVVEENLVQAIASLQLPHALGRFFAMCEAELSQRADDGHTDIKRLEADLATAEAAIRRWGRGYETGRMKWDDYLENVQPHKDRIKAIKDQLEKAAKLPTLPPRAALASFAVDFKQAWEHLEPPERKALLQHFVRSFGVKILVYPDRSVALVPAG